MKTKTPIVLTVLLAAFSLQAGTFIGPTTTGNRFVLSPGQTAIITAIYAQKQYDNYFDLTNTVPMSASIINGGQTSPVYIGECKLGTTALVGPLELVVSSQGIITYKLINNTPIQCPVIQPGSSNSINVPSGKSIKFMSFDLSGFDILIQNGQIVSNGSSLQGVDIYGGAELDGPLTISFLYPTSFGSPPGTPTLAYTLPYYLTDSSIVLPDKMALQSATGNVEIQLQKSSDLTNWFSSVAIQATNQANTFYRLRIAK